MMSAKIHIFGMSGVIENTIFVDRLDDWPNAIDASEGGTIGQYKNEDGEWVFPAPTDEKINAQWDAIRAERNAKLAETDWTQIADAPVEAEAWLTYRQGLRDITEQEDPFNIIWPEKPE
jgi:hypothetical protein